MKVDYAAEHKENMDISLEFLETFAIALRLLDARRNTLIDKGLPTKQEDNERAMLLRCFDSQLNTLLTLMSSRYVDESDWQRVKDFGLKHPIFSERSKAINGRRGQR